MSFLSSIPKKNKMFIHAYLRPNLYNVCFDFGDTSLRYMYKGDPI